ncbi:alpha/beta fold hydrolase [Bradyrhizobium sp. STM 3843]|uniref:thioesterase domain-containing protein n=1 Tax=Bradyrhizobium sp. STM 3843 TaxID=551947 RepID=UPI001585F9F7|nr:alpha/beta fold hydrolase [Bradyrhizobium sp. STM 3843]
MSDNLFGVPGLDARSHVVELRRSDRGTPLVCFPGSGGDPRIFCELAAALGESQSVYAINMEWLCRARGRFTVEQVAALYLDVVQSIKGAGPYCLCGYSFGGIVAYEIARLLQEQGHRVAFVALLDCPNPSLEADLSPAASAEFRRAYLADRLGRYAHHLLRGDLRAFAGRALAFLISRSSERLMPLIKAAFRIANRPLPAIVQSNDPGFLHAWKSYRPPSSSSDLVCFRIEDRGAEHDRDPSMGWAGYTSGNIDVHVVPADHVGMMSAPSVNMIAETLSSCLRDSNSFGLAPGHSKKPLAPSG